MDSDTIKEVCSNIFFYCFLWFFDLQCYSIIIFVCFFLYPLRFLSLHSRSPLAHSVLCWSAPVCVCVALSPGMGLCGAHGLCVCCTLSPSVHTPHRQVPLCSYPSHTQLHRRVCIAHTLHTHAPHAHILQWAQRISSPAYA